MTASLIRHHQNLYRQLDALAAHAYVMGDLRRMDQYLDSRNSLGNALREGSHPAWAQVRVNAFRPAPETPASPHGS